MDYVQGLHDFDLERVLRNFVEDPQAGLDLIDKTQSKKSLLAFSEVMWSVHHPAQPFVRGWAIEAIADHLAAITAGHIRKLIINVPPGFMKSLLANVYWPAWEWGPLEQPWLKHIVASYADKLSADHNEKLRKLVKDERYKRLWPHVQIDRGNDQKTHFENIRTGFSSTVSIRGATTGKRANRFKGDDIHNPIGVESTSIREEALTWATEVVPTRLCDQTKDAIIWIMQRTHLSDVSGHFLSKDLGYEHLCIPMRYEKDHPHPSKTFIYFVDPRTEEGELAFPERFPEEEVESVEKTMMSKGGEYSVLGQMQQKPISREGGFFKRDWWKEVDAPPEMVIARVRGWDLAASKANKNATNARTAGVIVSIGHDRKVYIEHACAAHKSPGAMENWLCEIAKADGSGVVQDIPQDPGQAGKTQAREFIRRLQGLRVHTSPESGEKEIRLLPVAIQAEIGNLYLVRGPWNEEFMDELEKLRPGDGTRKDLADACSRAYARASATEWIQH